ncbi:DNA polymerase beta superfamily protein [Actinomadura sp. LOL_016]|uniref:DNA polymerase beta superfamily protein n=1 Tax=unclassified Actinomadura TaxID=2626254 RepID=UPI003A813212
MTITSTDADMVTRVIDGFRQHSGGGICPVCRACADHGLGHYCITQPGSINPVLTDLPQHAVEPLPRTRPRRSTARTSAAASTAPGASAAAAPSAPAEALVAEPESVLLSGIVGSTAYGLAGPGSDIDRLGMYAAPTVDFHGLTPPTGRAASRVTTDPDVTFHEAAKYATLCLNVNPTVTELMWLPDELYEARTSLGEQLIAIRSAFLSARRVRDAYLGYATQQFRRLEARGDGSFSADTRKRTAKHARHLARLVRQGVQLYRTGALDVRLPNPDWYREFGERVAAGELEEARFLLAEAEADFAGARTPLPDEPDRARTVRAGRPPGRRAVRLRRRHLRHPGARLAARHRTPHRHLSRREHVSEPDAPASPAEEMAVLVAELVDEVRTEERITRYREVNRGGRTVKVVDPDARHVTRDVGLLHQLHAIKAAKATIPVEIHRWESDHKTKEDRCKAAREGRKCPHGRYVHVRTEQRPAGRLGVVTAGAAVPSGSAGWDETGALNPLRSLGFESATPATSAPELHDAIRRGIDRLRADLRAAAERTWGGRKAPSDALREIVGLVAEVDDDTAHDAVRRARGWVTAARIHLRYDAPIVRLRELVCGQCRGDLHVRADASTAVWCAGHPAIEVLGPTLLGGDWGPVEYRAEPGCGERYPRGSWIRLLEDAAKAG